MRRANLMPISALVFLAVLAGVGALNSSHYVRTEAELYAAGKVALAAQQWDQAIVYFETLVGLDPSYRDAEEQLAQALDNDMVYVPAGEFLMGSDVGDMDERPQRRVYLDAFEIDKVEVTNVQYRRFLLATGHDAPHRWPDRYVHQLPDRDPDWHNMVYPAGEAMYPVVGVNWQDATDYYTFAPRRNPQGPSSGTGERIQRGGAWDSSPDHARVSYRNATHCFGPNFRVGFRCARSVGP